MPSATVETNLPAVQATTATDPSTRISDTINITKIITENLISEKLTDKSDIDCSSNAGNAAPKSPSSPTKTTKPDNSTSNSENKTKNSEINRKPSKSKQTSIKGQPGDPVNNLSAPSQANSRTSKLTRSPSGRSKETTVERRTSRREKKNATAKISDPNKSDVRSNTPPGTSQVKREASRRKTDTPPHLNLAFKTDPQSKESSGRSSAVSPKIRELRKSEALQNKSSGDESASDRRKTSTKSTGGSKRRHWSVARHAIKTTTAVRAKGESVDKELLKRLEQENSQLPPQVGKFFKRDVPKSYDNE